MAEHTVPPPFTAVLLSTEAREHLLHGNLDKYGDSQGWHYEPTGSAEKGTHVIQGTRSEPDVNGVYEANVMIEGVKKKAKSSFFPSRWTIAEIENAIEEAYLVRAPQPRGGHFQGTTAKGLVIRMDVDAKGRIQTAYPVYQGEQ